MNARNGAVLGLGLAIIGAILAFALKSPDSSFIGIRLESLGAVLLATGAVVVVAAGVMSVGPGNSSTDSSAVESLRAIGGLVAVVSAIVGVVALAIVTQSRLTSSQAESIVAIGTAAFGVVSAVVGAYLGIKVTADQSANAQKDAQVAHAQLGAAAEAVRQMAPDKEAEVKKAMAAAGEEAAKAPGGHGS